MKSGTAKLIRRFERVVNDPELVAVIRKSWDKMSAEQRGKLTKTMKDYIDGKHT